MDTTPTIRHWLPDAEARELLDTWGSPLHVYDETILRARLRTIRDLLPGRAWHPSISAKANGNPHLLALAREEGLRGDAMSPGEIHLLETAGFLPEDIFLVAHNASLEELSFATRRGISVSLDALDAVRLFARHRLAPEAALRIDPGIGVGHHDMVVTAGGTSKFGLLPQELPEALRILSHAGIRVAGLNQHIGSGSRDPAPFLEAAARLLRLARSVPDLRFVDFGGGIGIPYQDGEMPPDLGSLARGLGVLLDSHERETGQGIEARIEPGRFWCAEGGCLLGTVHAVKERGGTLLAGTDLGFNVFQRTVLYGAIHRIDLLPRGGSPRETVPVTWVGNICEGGDVLAHDLAGPRPSAEDAVRVRDTGAYGSSMGSNYNGRFRPAEVLRGADGNCRIIRRRDRPDDLTALVPPISASASPDLEARLPALRALMEERCGRPESRPGPGFFSQHVLVVEAWCRRLAPLFGADLDVVLPAALLHDIAAVEDFSRVAEHHVLGALRAGEVLRAHGFPTDLATKACACMELHVLPLDPGAHGAEAACLSHADALAQLERPLFWLDYAGRARSLDPEAARAWYAALVEDRAGRLSAPVAEIAAPLVARALKSVHPEEETLPCS